MNAMFCPTPAELRALIHWHAERREQAALVGDRAAYDAAQRRIAELQAMLPENQYEAAA